MCGYISYDIFKIKNMINLPINSEDTVTGCINEYFAPYARPKMGDYLIYNPRQDKMIIMTINDKPECVVIDVCKSIFKNKSTITIRKL